MKQFFVNFYYKVALLFIFPLAFSSCADYLDVVPDNIATIEHAFTMRVEAKKYLFTCYSYMPHDGQLDNDPAIMGGDEMWSVFEPQQAQYGDGAFRIARGLQNAGSPLINKWAGLYQGIRTCNIFLENVQKVPDIPAWEKTQWASEVTFLKAYYHFYLLRMYGPIPIIKENKPISAGVEEVRVSRNTVDECFNYIVELIDESLLGLDSVVINPVEELGRITKPIAAAWIA
jgi:hypothetical protein